MTVVRRLSSDELTPRELASLRTLFDASTPDPGDERTPEEDGFVLVRLTPTSPDLDLSAPISCEWRPGDVW